MPATDFDVATVGWPRGPTPGIFIAWRRVTAVGLPGEKPEVEQTTATIPKPDQLFIMRHIGGEHSRCRDGPHPDCTARLVDILTKLKRHDTTIMYAHVDLWQVNMAVHGGREATVALWRRHSSNAAATLEQREVLERTALGRQLVRFAEATQRLATLHGRRMEAGEVMHNCGASTATRAPADSPRPTATPRVGKRRRTWETTHRAAKQPRSSYVRGTEDGLVLSAAAGIIMGAQPSREDATPASVTITATAVLPPTTAPSVAAATTTAAAPVPVVAAATATTTAATATVVDAAADSVVLDQLLDPCALDQLLDPRTSGIDDVADTSSVWLQAEEAARLDGMAGLCDLADGLTRWNDLDDTLVSPLGPSWLTTSGGGGVDDDLSWIPWPEQSAPLPPNADVNVGEWNRDGAAHAPSLSLVSDSADDNQWDALMTPKLLIDL